MRQKLNLYKPATMLLLLALTIITLLVGLMGSEVSVAVLVIYSLSCIATFVLWNGANKETDNFIKSMGKAISSTQSEALVYFPIPVIVAKDEEIVWYNNICTTEVLQNENWLSKNVSELFGKSTPSSPTKRLVHNHKDYEVFSVTGQRSGEDVTIYYLYDVTQMRSDATEYHKSHLAVFLITIDSLDEILEDAKENERSQLLSQVEYQIEKFFGEREGIVIKSHRGRFLGLMQDRYMDEVQKNRFQLLDNVRALTIGDGTQVTLSIGVSRGNTSLIEGDNQSHQALDMALGRGGDQAAVKNPNGYDFYGGLSKGVEKRTKVKTRIIATALAELIDSSHNVIIMGHKYADLDCFGAAVGLMKIVRQKGKPCVIAINRNRNLVESLLESLEQNGYDNSFVSPADAMNKINPKTLLIVVDTHVPHVLESMELYKACKNVVVIDHHRRMVGHIDNAVIFYHEPYASSTCEMVTELAQYFGLKNPISRIEAEALLAGIMLDTKNFVMRTGVRTFEAAAYLRRQGADTVEVRRMFSSTMESYQHRARLVSSAEVYHRCAIAFTSSITDDIKIVAPQAADELLNISDVDASFVLYEYDDGVSISSRSMGKFNVQIIMERLGGGGHQTMAATQIPNVSMEDARQMLLDAIEEYSVNNATAINDK